MSHEITKLDRQQGIEQAWHGLTEIRNPLTLADSWLAQWDIVKAPLYTVENGQPSETEFCQIVASDNSKIRIGTPVHCETYQPVTNADFLRIVNDALLGITGVRVASVGSVCARGRVFVSVKLTELESFKAAKREFKPYLNFLNSHDQSSVFAVNTSNTCTVCNNTFSMNLHDKTGTGLRVRLKHTRNVGQRLENIPELVDGFLGAQAEFRAKMDTFDSQPIAEKHARSFFTGFLTPKVNAENLNTADLELSTRKTNQIDRLTSLFSTGVGSRGETLADVFSAVTDYYTHESSGGDDIEKQIVSSDYGMGQAQKDRAWNVLQSRDMVNETVRIGNHVLAAN